MGKTLASADITLLDFSVLLDLSTATPVISITNLSTVVNPANLQWIFEVFSPSGIPIHVGNFSVPDIDSIPFTTYIVAEPIPRMFGQIEFSKTGQYLVKVSVKDNAGEINYLEKGSTPLCAPNGNNGRNNFGAAIVEMENKCAQGQLYVTDKTNLIFNSLEGIKVQTLVELTYPKDANDNTIPPVTVGSIPALLPIKYEGEGHELYAFHIYDYDMGDNFFVRVRYSYRKEFDVWCNVTLQPLFCEIDQIVAMLQRCEDTAQSREANKKLNIINSKMLKAHTGIVQPLSDINVPEVVEEIKELLGVECECCRPQGISNVGIALATDAVFSANKVCGDMLLSFTNDGNGNIVLHYQDVTYTFVISDDSDSAAFEFVPTQTGCARQVALKVNIATLSQEFITEIGSNQSLKDQLTAILAQAQSSCTINGGALFNFSSCDYTVDIVTTPVGTAIGKIVINGDDYVAPDGTIATDAAAIQTWLNSLAQGAFTAVYNPGTNKTTIISLANTNVISTISTTGTGGAKTYLFINNCGLVCSILQKVVTYLNEQKLINITSGVEVTICTFDTVGNVVPTVFPDTTTANVLALAWSQAICNIANFMKTRVLSCANIKTLFAAFTSTTGDPTSGDIIFGLKNGNCQQYPLKNIALGIMRLLQNDAEVKAQYCLVTPCSTVSTCSPVTGLSGIITDTTATYSWTSVLSAIGYKWSIDGINWNSVGSTFANVTGLTAATAYTFRVYPVYSSGDGTDCVVTVGFTTTNTGAGCIAPANLVLSATDTTLTGDWDAVPGASGYQYRLNGGSWVNIGNVITTDVFGLTPSTLYNFEVRAQIGGENCPMSSSDSVTTDEAVNFIISASYGMSIDSVTGTGIPSLPSTGVNGSESGHHTNVTGTLVVVITGATVPGTSLLAYKGSPITILATVNISAGPGTYNLTGITAAESEYLSVSIVI